MIDIFNKEATGVEFHLLTLSKGASKCSHYKWGFSNSHFQEENFYIKEDISTG